VFSPEGNNLDAYRGTPPFVHQRLNTNHDDDPAGWDVNGQVCFLDGRRFVAGEDTGQPDPPAGWGVFRFRGNRVGKLSVRRVARLVPPYQPTDTEPDTFGCGVLSDGRIVTTVIGNNQSGATDGEVVLWFPPYTRRRGGAPIRSCLLDTGIGTAQGVYVDDEDRIYVASARGTTAGVLRYTGPFPTAPTRKGGCGRLDVSGAPRADAVRRERVVVPGPESHLAVANGLSGSDRDTLFVSSVITGVIVELELDGTYVRTVLAPPAGETLGAKPFSTGTPLGLATGPDGSLYYADLGLVVDGGGIGPRARTGSVRRIPFAGDPAAPGPPETMADDLTFPDGLGVWVPPGAREGSS
jgi:hypothetical protein